MSEVKKAIIDFCQAEGLNRVFGKEHAVTYKLVEKTGFNEDEIRALLEPEGLWARVLGFDPARLKELLDDKQVPDELRRELRALEQVISASPRLWVKQLAEEE